MNVRDFFYEQRAPQLVRVVDLPTDPKVAARNEERAALARARMGERWVFHPANQVKRRTAV